MMKGFELLDTFEKTCRSITEHLRLYPHMQVKDLFKFIYQSSYGCEHMVTDLPAVARYIRKEKDALRASDRCSIIPLDGAYSRVDLSIIESGISPETLAKLFCLSAKKEENGIEALREKLVAAEKLVSEGVLPFSKAMYADEVKRWGEKGFPPVHHSEEFRAEYKPAYRVISNRMIPFLPLFAKLDSMLAQNKPVRFAVEGGSASGKTTLAKLISDIYSCTVFHMDDYFLRPEQRTAERFAEPGGNVDRERFLEEVLLPMSRGETVEYRVFDCSAFKLMPPVKVKPEKLCVIEGAYSMHPELEQYYDLSVFLDISQEYQRKRIMKRNSPQMAERFFGEWIPMEHLYFDKLNVKERCDLVIPINSDE